MVRGAVFQLAAIGRQNIDLIGNPQLSYFVSVYKRHTNFTYQDIRQNITGDANYGKKIQYKLNKVGDLIGAMYLNIVLPDLDDLNTDKSDPVSWVNAVGHAIIRSYSIRIGETIIDKQYGTWLEIWSELTVNNDHRTAYNNLVGKHNYFTNSTQTGSLELYIPLQFWFCKNVSLALPIIALQRQDVIIEFEFSDFDELVTTRDPVIATDKQFKCEFYIKNYFLDDAERKVFARNKYRYLIEQLQIQTISFDRSTTEKVIDIPFNHPVKELIWVAQRQDSVNYIDDSGTEIINNLFNFSNVPDPTVSTTDNNTVLSSNFVFEGNDYFEDRRTTTGSGSSSVPSYYFRIVQPYEHHSRTPVNRYINVYSFALNPEEHQPSGSLNFSMIDNAYLKIVLNPHNESNEISNQYFITVFATNYNILSIEDGIASLEYVD
tara:strand:- start:2241 stop:3539 length:1299 start_codon:yes stop_codon:yes gene_type:complete